MNLEGLDARYTLELETVTWQFFTQPFLQMFSNADELKPFVTITSVSCVSRYFHQLIPRHCHHLSYSRWGKGACFKSQPFTGVSGNQKFLKGNLKRSLLQPNQFRKEITSNHTTVSSAPISNTCCKLSGFFTVNNNETIKRKSFSKLTRILPIAKYLRN